MPDQLPQCSGLTDNNGNPTGVLTMEPGEYCVAYNSNPDALTGQEKENLKRLYKCRTNIPSAQLLDRYGWDRDNQNISLGATAKVAWPIDGDSQLLVKCPQQHMRHAPSAQDEAEAQRVEAEAQREFDSQVLLARAAVERLHTARAALEQAQRRTDPDQFSPKTPKKTRRTKKSRRTKKKTRRTKKTRGAKKKRGTKKRRRTKKK